MTVDFDEFEVIYYESNFNFLEEIYKIYWEFLKFSLIISYYLDILSYVWLTSIFSSFNDTVTSVV